MPNNQEAISIRFADEFENKNSNIQKGKSAGYRLVYQVESPTNVLLLTIYAKSDRDDISSNEIFSILSSISDNE